MSNAVISLSTRPEDPEKVAAAYLVAPLPCGRGEGGVRLDEFGRYRLLGLIGEGGMGKVFKAHDTAIDRDVAIKVLPTDLAKEPGYRERFRREAHTAARLTEPHIIPIYDFGEIDGRLYLVMPIIDGIDVGTLLKRDGAMSPSRAVRLIEQLAAALDTAHAHGLVHRDVKPSNALMTTRGFVYLIDFGIAHHTAATTLTRTGIVVGTPAYMAPERFTSGDVDARADVYALTCVLYECLTGEKPYPGDSMEQQIAGHLSLDPPRPSEHRSAVPHGFDEVIARGMAKKPDMRYHSAGDLAGAAHAALTTPQRHQAASTSHRSQVATRDARRSLKLPGLMHTLLRVIGVLPRSGRERSTRLRLCRGTGAARRSVRAVGVVPGLPDLGAESAAVRYGQAGGAGPGADLGGARLRCGRVPGRAR